MEAKNGPYAFDIHPAFWRWLDGQAEAGSVSSSSIVLSEILKGKDELAEWCRARRTSGLFPAPDRDVQAVYTQIAEVVYDNYTAKYAQHFLAGADGWVIAQAKISGSKVVTFEQRVPPTAHKVKIPNISDRFGVRCVTLYSMLRSLKARFREHD